ncbi:hypothetical protein DI392_10320 [Vibrio albus]|uniref:Chemotaxis methyl-accepting receptor HlyB-like 4HB MCP domain-containing protein n=1 Tax=Vibrio albus TaxID=2200953 RepID=A0A2U3B8Z8_9VIBR|nr:MCP four helix bundle domain-containing protein [Vibrio albus]PWI33247.1 hypothetical protein DI392_10320 [Vibrio albus]
MLKNLRLGLKIGLGFCIVLALLVTVSGTSIVSLKKAEDGIIKYREFVRNTNLVSNIQTNILMMRMNVINYFSTESDESVQKYKHYLSDMQNHLQDAKQDIQNPKQALLISDIDSTVSAYQNAFSQLIELTRKIS